MLKKTKLFTVIAATLISGSAIAANQSFDSRSHAMGGVGVSSADYLTAPFHNPALVAKYGDSDDVGILIPSIGAQAYDPNSLVDGLDSFVDLYDSINTSNPTQGELEDIVNGLTDLQGDQAFVQAGVAIAVAIPNDYVSVNMFVKGYADGFVLADVSDADLALANGNSTSLELSSQGVTMGVGIVEAGVAFAKDFETDSGTWYVGFTPKYQQVTTINYVVDIEEYDFDNWDDDRYQSEESNFNVDVGVVYAMDSGWAFGLSGRNLIENSYETSKVTGANVEGVYNINPIYTVSTSFNHDLFTLAVDVELNESEGYESVTGLEIGEVDPEGDNTQMAGIGAEFNAWDWAQVRVGYQHDLSDNLDDQITAGLGFSPFGSVHMDISGSYAGDEQFGAVFQTYFTF